jgi:hypothetical protein
MFFYISLFQPYIPAKALTSTPAKILPFKPALLASNQI